MRVSTATLLLLCGCNSLIGIEKLHNGAAPDAGQPAENQVEGGSTGSSAGRAAPEADGGGGRAANGSGGKTASGNTGAGGSRPSEPAAPSGGTGGTGGTGGSAPSTPAATSGGAPAPSTAGAAGAAPSGSGAVHGRVIDYRRNPVPDVPVHIGDQSARTDMDGRFSIDNVPASYDVTLSIHTIVNNSNARGAWQMQGLTRRDPTLQVDRGLPGESAYVLLKANNVTFPLRAEQRLAVTWASAHGEMQTDISGAGGVMTDASWIGAKSSPGNAHALLYEVSKDPETPSAYTAHDARPLTLMDGTNDAQVEFDVSAQSIASDKVSGTLAGPRDNRELHFFLRFSDGTAMALPSLYPMNDAFSYLAPKLQGVTLSVLFENSSNGRNTGQSAVLLDNVMPGQSGIVLSLPSIPTHIAPASEKSNVGPDTEFQWSSDAKVFLLCSESSTWYEKACVLTSQQKALLPVSPRSDYVPTANDAQFWYVEVHGAWNSVDEACGEGGFMSPGYAISSLPQVPRGSGIYATSGNWGFTTPP